jgi:hypothetical protein
LSLDREQLKADFLTFDFLEPIDYYSRSDEDGSFSLTGSQIQALSTRGSVETESDLEAIGAGRRTLIWHFLVDDLTDVYSGSALDDAAKPRDRLEDSSGRLWEVYTVQVVTAGIRYRLTCVEVLTDPPSE